MNKKYKDIKEFSSTNSITENKKEKDKVVQYVHERLKYLHGLKSHRFIKYWQYRNEYSQSNEIKSSDDGFIQYSMNTGFALVNAKVAEIFANTPKYDFVGLDENGRRYKKAVELIWNWVWTQSGTNKALTSIIRDACKYGSGFGIEKYTIKKRNVKYPTVGDDGVVDFVDKEVIDYKGCELVPLEWENVFINGNTIDSATEGILITHWDKDEFFLSFPNGKFYTYEDGSIVPGKMYYTRNSSNTLELGGNTGTSRTSDNSDNSNTISVIEYWNKYRDEYIIIANDVHINKYNGQIMPNPYPHKEIPIVQYVDHAIDGDVYGRGEYDITEKSRSLKDVSRSLMIETIKIQGGIITIDPSSDFDESVERIGLKQFAHVAKEDFGFFAPNVNVSPLELLEKRLDDDIIIETGVDFKGQLFGPGETAERTKGRIESARKRINSNIRENAYSFYERLAKLRIENIKTFYKGDEGLIPVEGYSVSSDGTQETISKGYGTMEITKQMLEGKILLIPVIDSLTGSTSKELRQRWMEFFQLIINLKKPDGSPIVPFEQLIDSGRGIIDDAVDLDKLLGGDVSTKNEINKRLAERGLPSLEDGMAQMNGGGGGIPPAQQSGRPVLLPSASSDNLTE